MGQGSLQRGTVTISYEDSFLRLTSRAPLEGILNSFIALEHQGDNYKKAGFNDEREYLRQYEPMEIQQKGYSLPTTTRLLARDGSFQPLPSLLRERFKQKVDLRALPANPSWVRQDAPAAIKERYLSRDEFLELARSFYDHNNQVEYGDELTKYLYVILTSLGAEGGMLQGLFEPRRMITVVDTGVDRSLSQGQHGLLAYVSGEQLQHKPPFNGFIGIKLPHLQGQVPELLLLSEVFDNRTPSISQRLDALLGKEGLSLCWNMYGGYLSLAPSIPQGYLCPTKETVGQAIEKVQKAYDGLKKE